jgi:Protein of unknown function (DUF1207).
LCDDVLTDSRHQLARKNNIHVFPYFPECILLPVRFTKHFRSARDIITAHIFQRPFSGEIIHSDGDRFQKKSCFGEHWRNIKQLGASALLGVMVTLSPFSSVGYPAPPADTITLDQDLNQTVSASSSTTGSQNSGGPWKLTLLPNQDPFTPLLADPRQPTTSINFLTLSNQPFIQFNGNFGVDIGVARWESPTQGINESVQVGVMGASFSRFSIIQSSTFLEDADYVIGVPVTFRYHSFSGRVFFYHESSPHRVQLHNPDAYFENFGFRK